MELFRGVYRIKGGHVFWQGRPILHADASSFVHLGGAWARDHKTVFVQGSTRKAVDLSTWEYLNPVYARDARAAYDWQGRIKGADPSTFEVLDPGIFVEESLATRVWARGYARDAVAVYYHDQMFGRASALRDADPASFVSLRNDYGYDAQRVWHQKSRLPGADPITWVYLGRLWSMDARRVFYAGREVTGLARSKFTVVNAPIIGNLSTDGHRYFDADREIDAAEFWGRLRENFSKFEVRFEVSLRKIVGGEQA